MSFSFYHLCSGHKVTIAALSCPVQWPLAFRRHRFQEALKVTTGDSLIQRCPCPLWVTSACILLARTCAPEASETQSPNSEGLFCGTPLDTKYHVIRVDPGNRNFTRYFKQDKGRALVIQDLQGLERK